MQIQPIFPRNQSEIRLLGIDGKSMARTELDNISARLEQIALVAQGAQALILDTLEARLEVVSLNRVAQLTQLRR